MDKVLTVSVIGMGARGFLYASLMKDRPDQFRIVAVCECIEERRNNARKAFSLCDDALLKRKRISSGKSEATC